MVKELDREVEIPEGVEIKVEDSTIYVSGPKGKLSKGVSTKDISITIEDNKVKITPKRQRTKREKSLVNTYQSHIRNMIKGVTEGFTYMLKICSSHFPITAEVKDGVFKVSNFIGEKIPRQTTLPEGVEVNVDGETVTVTSPDKELAGQTAADIEKLTKRSDFDRRIFTDGIFITQKAGVNIKDMK